MKTQQQLVEEAKAILLKDDQTSNKWEEMEVEIRRYHDDPAMYSLQAERKAGPSAIREYYIDFFNMMYSMDDAHANAILDYLQLPGTMYNS